MVFGTLPDAMPQNATTAQLRAFGMLLCQKLGDPEISGRKTVARVERGSVAIIAFAAMPSCRIPATPTELTREDGELPTGMTFKFRCDHGGKKNTPRNTWDFGKYCRVMKGAGFACGICNGTRTASDIFSRTVRASYQ